ncbi:extracellular solute-binding protein [Pseudochrobactrum asaccharolyticum]|jgi:multiple sugar transport system substrate-binding protein|uniref:Carbohydrate ABC transporter substrate-binding protein (CUT1 family) n=1 Tax=Pseudochrobactrum asaccharolyticum TaxID=354351 RepID=A0A366DZX5_9HYPH|nr:extracellular solute-binding protein [Pseudochrobactrum asaccharolyticum]MBX8800318.1 extracellular solute-binding protein [Ochrobactrum sp. MR28]MBX8815930.1 extracellular solute-binding protein [Ochrobactrum sp. MR31]MDR2310798.1 extracellular solute-binding protein [Brucellaceae bacterium]RBO95597.1 carbohydrate ABC transporter substrate-binding protein (CUT1 family) [Pseudochrobactrum asaccharolyticum]
MRKLLFAGLIAGFSTMAFNAAQAVEIEYWQYVFESRVKAMDKLIENFEKANPDIKVKHTTFPYDDYQTRVIAAKMAGNSPDVMQLFYGWLDKFVAGGILQPLPTDTFPHDKIESDFFPITSAMKRGDDYYGLPTAVRSLALFYNKKLFEEAGLDPKNPPKTLDELVAAAEKTAKRDANGNLTTAGITMDMAGQDHHWWREVLIRQYGGVPYTDNDRKVAYDSEAGEKALKFYTDLQTEKKVGEPKFMDEGQAAFRAGMAAMTVDGTFRLGAFRTIKDFEWGVTELPANADGVRSNYASYFANGIGANAKGEKLEAAKKFLNYISSPEAMEIWLKEVGELPARRAVAQTEANLADPIYGPFLKGLDYAHTTMFVDEAAQRQTAMDMVNRVILEKQPVKESLAQAAKAEQTIIDDAQ